MHFLKLKLTLLYQISNFVWGKIWEFFCHVHKLHCCFPSQTQFRSGIPPTTETTCTSSLRRRPVSGLCSTRSSFTPCAPATTPTPDRTPWWRSSWWRWPASAPGWSASGFRTNAAKTRRSPSSWSKFSSSSTTTKPWVTEWGTPQRFHGKLDFTAQKCSAPARNAAYWTIQDQINHLLNNKNANSNYAISTERYLT